MNTNEALQKALRALTQAKEDKKRGEDILKSLGPAVVEALRPILGEISVNSKVTKKELLDALANVKIESPRVDKVEVRVPDINVPEARVTVDIPKIEIPEVKLPTINVPKPEVTVNVPPIKIPEIKWPESNLPIEGWVQLMGVDIQHPLPVQLRDSKGNPVNLLDNITQVISGGGGGIARTVKVSGVTNTVGVVNINPDGSAAAAGSVTIAGSSGTLAAVIVDGTGVAWTGSNPIPVTITSGASATSAVNLVDSTGVIYNGDNPLNVDGTVAVSGITNSVSATLVDSSGVAYSGSNPVPTSGSATLDAATNQGDTEGRTLRVVHAGDSGVSTNVINGHLDVLQLSGSIDSVYLTGSTGTVAVVTLDPDGNPFYPASVSLDLATNQGDTDGRTLRVVHVGDSGVSVHQIDGHIDVLQLSGSIDSVYITGASGTLAANIVDSSGVAYTTANPLPISDAGGSVTVDGTFWQATQPVSGTVAVSGITNTIAANIVDSSGVAFGGANPLDIDGTVVVSSVTASVAANVVDSTGVAYTTSNPLPITLATGLRTDLDSITVSQLSGAIDSVYITGSSGTVAANIVDSSGVAYSGSSPVPVYLVANQISSTVVVGPTVADAANDGSAPIQIGGMARTTNPTAMADGDVIKSSFDDLGRQLVRHQARDLTASAYVSLSTGTETTLIAGVASTFLDMIWVVGANQSDAAVAVDFRSGTGGSTLLTLEIPANGTAGAMFGADHLQQEVVAGAWTADMPDITGTTVNISAKFSKEI